MIKYCAFHVSEPGYDSPEDVQEWIDTQDNPDDYFIVATDDDFEPRPEAPKPYKREELDRLRNDIREVQIPIIVNLSSLDVVDAVLEVLLNRKDTVDRIIKDLSNRGEL